MGDKATSNALTKFHESGKEYREDLQDLHDLQDYA